MNKKILLVLLFLMVSGVFSALAEKEHVSTGSIASIDDAPLKFVRSISSISEGYLYYFTSEGRSIVFHIPTLVTGLSGQKVSPLEYTIVIDGQRVILKTTSKESQMLSNLVVVGIDKNSLLDEEIIQLELLKKFLISGLPFETTALNFSAVVSAIQLIRSGEPIMAIHAKGANGQWILMGENFRIILKYNGIIAARESMEDHAKIYQLSQVHILENLSKSVSDYVDRLARRDRSITTDIWKNFNSDINDVLANTLRLSASIDSSIAAEIRGKAAMGKVEK